MSPASSDGASSSYPDGQSNGASRTRNLVQTNGDFGADAPACRPNTVFADFQFYDPASDVQAGQVVEPGMLIRATSTPEYGEVVANSSAIAYLYHDGHDQPVLNGMVQATAQVVDPDPDFDLGVTEESVTVQYEWAGFSVHQPGTYYYRVLVSARAADSQVVSLGVYDSATVRVRSLETATET